MSDETTRVRLTLSTESAEALAELASGERMQGKYLDDVIGKLASGWRLTPPDAEIDARLTMIEATLKRMALEK